MSPRTTGGKKHGKSPVFDKVDPYSLRLANTSMVIGTNVLTYIELVSIMTKCHKTIEVIRKVPTGTPGPAFPNAKLRTDPGTPVPRPGVMMLSPVNNLQELTRSGRGPDRVAGPVYRQRSRSYLREPLASLLVIVRWANLRLSSPVRLD